MGVAAAGLADVPGRLRAMFGDALVELDGATDRLANRSVLAAHIGEKSRDMRPGAFMIPAGAPWTEEWVRDAAEFVRVHRAASKLQVIFVAGPASVWAMLEANKNVFDDMEPLGVNS